MPRTASSRPGRRAPSRSTTVDPPLAGRSPQPTRWRSSAFGSRPLGRPQPRSEPRLPDSRCTPEVRPSPWPAPRSAGKPGGPSPLGPRTPAPRPQRGGPCAGPPCRGTSTRGRPGSSRDLLPGARPPSRGSPGGSKGIDRPGRSHPRRSRPGTEPARATHAGTRRPREAARPCPQGFEGARRNEPCGPSPPVLSATSPNPFIVRAHAHYRGEKQTRLRNVTSVREELAPHVHDINRALGNKVSEQEIERELSSYLNVYRVSLDTAKRSIVKKHGGNPATLAIGVSKTIRELGPGEPSVNLLARIVAVYEKEVTPQGQETKTILSGILGDATATVPFTAWEPLPTPLAKGDVIRVQNAYTKEYRGQVQVNFGVRTAVGKEAPDSLPEFKPGLGQPYVGKPTPVRVVDLREGASNVAVTARVLSVERREVEVDGNPKAVFSGVLADETAKTQFSAWKDFDLKAEEVLRIEGAYVKSWRGIPQISFDERATITRLKSDLLPPANVLNASPRMWIEDLAERGGGADVTARGVLIDLPGGSGLVYRCPECRRVLRKGACRLHGEVKGEPDLRVKAVLDDGSGAVTAVFDRELTEALFDKTLDACIEAARNAMSTDVVRDELADVLVAQPIEVRGDVTSDDYGLMMIVASAKMLKVDVQTEAREMLEGLEGSA